MNKEPTPPTDPASQLELVQVLFVKHQPLVRVAALAILPDFDKVDDVVQETFLTMLRKAEDFVPGSNFTAWICSIARYKAMEMRRKSILPFETLSDSVLETLHAVEPAADDFEHKVRYFEECLGRLAPQARKVMGLRYEQALLPAAISKQMNWSVGAVKVALSRARNVLRDCVHLKLAAEDHLPDTESA